VFNYGIMKKIFLSFLVIGCAAAIAVAIISAAAPAVVFAQNQATISINPNIPGTQPGISTSGPCGWIVNFYDFALLIAGILAFGAIVYGGVKAATSAGNPSKISEGRAWIWSALLGLLLLGCAYLILYTINPNLTKCQLPVLSSINIASTQTSPFNISPPPGLGTSSGGELGSVAAQQLAGAGVSIKPGASVNGMQQGTVADIDALAQQCAQTDGGASCNVVITAGTDGAHAAGECSHSNGYKADLRSTPALSSFITSLPVAGTRSDGATLYAFNGGTIADETNLPGVSPHWDLSAACP
jgi:hypothetical protein